MRSFMLLSLLMFGCESGRVDVKSGKNCQNIEREFIVDVPFPWDELEDIETVKFPDGCTMTTTTHYVYNESDDGSAPVGSGNLPLGFYQRGCMWDGCEPFDVNQLPAFDRRSIVQH